MTYKPVSFPRGKGDDLLRALRTNVRAYFDENQLSSYGDHTMVIKSLAMISMYFVPYGLMVSGLVANPWVALVCWLVMGVGAAGIGMSVMHDANHGSYSSNPTVNRWVGYMLNVVGGLALNWKIQHNKLHHSFTNIEGHDEDIAPRVIMRFSPHDKRYSLHRFQHYYAWFFYGLMTLSWVTAKDFRQLADYHKRGLLGRQSEQFPMLMAKIALLKVAYFIYALVIPLLTINLPAWQIVGGFLLMHFTAGLILGSVFQLAHVMPSTEFPLPNDETNEIDHQWAAHQLKTTTNFAPNNRLLNWYVGGLNYQVEHHLFPNICHIHYPKIASIVKETAEAHGVPYNSVPTFRGALAYHADMLKRLGTQDFEPEKAKQPLAMS
jgi:linoleoyl-CoA desaturase